MDEPTAALSAEKIRVLMGLIEQLKARGVAILMISHRFTDILHVCDRIVVVRQGRIAGELAPHAQSARTDHGGHARADDRRCARGPGMSVRDRPVDGIRPQQGRGAARLAAAVDPTRRSDCSPS